VPELYMQVTVTGVEGVQNVSGLYMRVTVPAV
jgi:hypothetical protein